MNKYYQEIANSIPNLIFDLINIIYQYAINENDHAEYYHGTINCNESGLCSIESMSILENRLYVLGRHFMDYVLHQKTFCVHDLKTCKRLNKYHVAEHESFYNNICKDLKINICSRDYSNNDILIKTLYNGENVITFSDKYRFQWNGIFQCIQIVDKMTYLHKHDLYEKYQQKKENDTFFLDVMDKKIKVSVKKFAYSQKDITIYNNILYIIGYYSYECIDTLGCEYDVVESYVHLYNAHTFEFIREFIKLSSHHGPILFDKSIPICIGVTDIKIIIFFTGGKIRIWNKGDCV
jgi:hypothetical protein